MTYKVLLAGLLLKFVLVAHGQQAKVPVHLEDDMQSMTAYFNDGTIMDEAFHVACNNSNKQIAVWSMFYGFDLSRGGRYLSEVLMTPTIPKKPETETYSDSLLFHNVRDDPNDRTCSAACFKVAWAKTVASVRQYCEVSR